MTSAALCLGLIKINSNPGRAALEEEDRDLQAAMPPTDPLSSSQHKWAIDTHRGWHPGAHQLHTQPAGVATTMCNCMVVRWERKRSGAARALLREMELEIGRWRVVAHCEWQECRGAVRAIQQA